MRISHLIFLCLFAIFPTANLLEDENAKLLMEGLRKSLDGLETDRSKIRWDEKGFRVEEKNWQEKAGDWLNNIFEGKRRKRDVENLKKGYGEEVDSDELIRVNAKIVFYKNGTRMVDIQNGPLITVDPKGQISLDYRNGTMQKLGGGGGEVSEGISRNKRFASLDDLYMANGFEFEQKDAADFGRDPWENGPNGGKLERTEDSSEEDDGEWQWARATEQKNPYWDKPLYAGMGNGQQQNDGNRPKAIEIGGNQNQGKQQQPQQSSPIFPQQFQQQPAPPPKSKIWETIETPSTGNGMIARGNVQQNVGIPSVNNVGGLANSQTNKQQLSGGQSNQPTSFGQQPANPSPIQPPSPSPTSWLQVQLMSEKPLSPEEIEFAKELMRQILEQEEKRKAVGGGGTNGQTSMIGQNGSGNGQQQIGGGQIKPQQLGNVQQQPQQKPQNGLPKWAQPKGN